MARVGLTDYITSRIAQQAGTVMRETHGKLPAFPFEAPIGMGDELYSLVLPEENEKKVMELLPDGFINTVGGAYVSVAKAGQSTFRPQRIHEEVFAPFKAPRLHPYALPPIRNVPGIDTLEWRGNSITIRPQEDTSLIQQPAIREFVEQVLSVHNQRAAVFEAEKKAHTDMKEFLDQYSTLNNAAKDFGPAIWQYVPADIKQLHDKETAKAKKSKPDTPKVPEYLVAKAVEHSLNLH